jgi:ABC-type multidrug transport system fused ATPase/permease subunit
LRDPIPVSGTKSPHSSVNPQKKLWQLLTQGQRRAATLLLVLMLIGMIFETLSIGLIVPALALMAAPNVANSPWLRPLFDLLGHPSQGALVLVGMATLGLVYVGKSAFLTFLAWRQSTFVFWVQSNLSHRLFSGYLHQPYAFHLERNSAQLISNATTQIGAITGVVQQGLIVVAEALVICGISLLLLWVEPIGASLVVTTLGFAGWFFNRKTKIRTTNWGRSHYFHEGLRIQHLQQGLGGVKEVKMLGREDGFLAQYQTHNEGAAKAGQRQFTLQALPRIWMELLAVWGLVALIAAMIMCGKPLADLLPTLGLFSAAAFRLMPSVNRVLTSFQSVRFALPAIDILHGEFSRFGREAAPEDAKRLPFREAIMIENLDFNYPTDDRRVLHSISLTIPRGSAVGFIGGSGAGKSTLIDVILGLLFPVGGTIKVDGVDIRQNLRGWQGQIGYVPQSIFLIDDTLRRNVAFGLPDEVIDDAAIWRAIRAAQLEDFVNSLPNGLETEVGERGVRLSGGQKQRIGIARALYHDPEVLVLDEATSALDTDTERGVMDAVVSLHGRKTVLIVAHRLSTVEHCDKVFRLEGGCLKEAAPHPLKL